MSKDRLPVFAAIPNYNMARTLQPLLTQLTQEQETAYDQIMVLDDNSSDNSREMVEGFGGQVKWVGGDQNIGSAGNRNRIFGAIGAQEAFIHFMDADTQLEHTNAAEIVPQLLEPDIAMVGGLVRQRNGYPISYNYGPRMQLSSSLESLVQGATYDHPRLRKPFANRLADWPQPELPQEPGEPSNVLPSTETFWVSEANFVVNSSTFARLGGFDGRLREHEAQDFAIQAHNKGQRILFNPTISVVHLEGHIRSGNRNAAKIAAEARIARRHGLGRYLGLTPPRPGKS